MDIEKISSVSVRVLAFAKINLYLDVVGRRNDGYHLLETVMHTVSLHDVVLLTLDESSDIRISCGESVLPCGRENTAYKAAEVFFAVSGLKNPGLQIDISKKIPMCAGLGGGSADGAAVICGLNELFGAGLPMGELFSAAVQVGADVPFCIQGGAAYCTGIGEIITPLPLLSGYVVIAKGRKGISTADAFKKIDGIGGIGLDGVYEFYDKKPSVSALGGFCRNIFDDVTELDEVKDIKRIMAEHGALCTCMTGSGSAVYGLFEGERQGQICTAALSDSCEFAGLYRFI